MADWLTLKGIEKSFGSAVKALKGVDFVAELGEFVMLLGPLGSGKTTLINNVLKEPGGRRIAVVENEFGSVSIDHSLLRYGSSVC